MSTIEQFVETLPQGAKFDSDGRFTFARQRVSERFRLQSAHRPWAWAALAVQAGVALGATAAEIGQSKGGAFVRLALPDDSTLGALTSEDFWRGLDSERRGFREILVALQHALALASPTVRIDVTLARCGLTGTWTGSDCEFFESERAQGKNSLLLELEGPGLVLDLSALRFASIPVVRGSERISGVTFGPFLGQRTTYRHYLLGCSGPSLAIRLDRIYAASYRFETAEGWHQVDRPLGSVPPAVCRLVEFGGDLSNARWAPSELALSMGEWLAPGSTEPTRLSFDPGLDASLPGFNGLVVGCRAVFLRCDNPLSPVSCCFPVRSGLTLDCKALGRPVPPNWVVAVAADALTVDLSGFVVVEDERWARLAAWVSQQIAWMEALTPA